MSDSQSSANAPSRVAGTDRATRRSRLPLLIVIAITLVVISLIVQPPSEDPEAGPAVGKASPPLDLQPLVGNALRSIAEDLRGRVVLLHFWGTWCAPCKAEFPDLVQMQNELVQEDRFRFVPVSCAAFDDASLQALADQTDAYYRSIGTDVATYADPTGTTRRRLLDLMERDGMAYPTSILIDPEGEIRATWVGLPRGGVVAIRGHIEELLDRSKQIDNPAG